MDELIMDKTVEENSNNIDDVKKFSVFDSVWIAAALIAVEVYLKDCNAKREAYYFKQVDIIKRAQIYADGNVASARVSSWACADADSPVHNYLRGDNKENASLRRLCAPNELGGEKTIPKDLDENDKEPIFTLEDRKFSLSELFDFVKNKYPLCIGEDTEIDCLGLLKYLEENAGLPYKNPSKASADELPQINKLKEDGQRAISILGEMANRCNKYDFDYVDKGSWLDGSNIYIRKYLWCQMKYKHFKDCPESVSIFVEKSSVTDKARFRFSLEIKDDKASTEDRKKYYRMLDLPLDTEHKLQYYCGGNNFGTEMVAPEKDSALIKEKLNDGTYKKIQISYILENDDTLTNQYVLDKMDEAVGALKKYYDHVFEDELEPSVRVKEVNMSVEDNFDKNMILYGPPGTGKTYNSVVYAVAICDGKSLEDVQGQPYDSVLDRYNELRNQNRIDFTTFHQSYGYEEFIEGISPVIDSNDDSDHAEDITYRIKSGIFKEFCERARRPELKSDIILDNARIWKVTINNGQLNDTKKKCFEEGTVAIGFSANEDGAKDFVKKMQTGDIVLSFKTRKSIDAIGVITDDEIQTSDISMYKTYRNINWLVTGIDEYIYEINGNKLLNRPTVCGVPNMSVSDVMDIVKKYKPAIVDKNEKPYVFVIDEINRGNISKIFGELITLIENTKRAGEAEAMEAILPYSGKKFSVPKNVYIIGTMNTADRSIALMDTALRRRFQFVEMMPKADILRKIACDKVNAEGKEIDVAKMLDKINERIEYLYDREHTIGHAFFTGLKNNATIDKLAAIFEKSVIPLLQEYFYDDYSKIQMVLGDNDNKIDDKFKFIVRREIKPQSIFRGDVSDIDLPDYKYKIVYDNFKNAETYIKIYAE